MAATLTDSGELTYVSFPIDKTETDADGNVYVYGKATDGSVDSDEQIVDTDFSAKAIREWLDSGANVRVQHNAQRDPAGVGVEVNTGPEGDTWVKSLVVEPVAKALVLAKALRAYSVGIARPKIVRDGVARGGRIVDGEIVEISLVDRPANKNCGVELVRKSADDGHAEFSGKVFGTHDLIAKSATTTTPPVPSQATSTFSPADLKKLLDHRAVAEARAAEANKDAKDPSVGGGVDRSTIPAKDFAGRNRSFPIVKPGDVQDAASSIGRAGPDNYSSGELKRRIIAIARRKGPEFEAKLPASWKSPSDSNKGAQPPFDPSVAPVTSIDPEVSVEPEAPITDIPDMASKGMKDCPKCDMSYDADSKLRKCEGCGAKLPLADKSSEPKVTKGKPKMLCAGCGANIHMKHNFCPECGNDMTAMKAQKCDCGNMPGSCDCPASCDCGCNKADKGHDFTCLGCGKDLDDDEKFCPGCGKENPGYESMNMKASKPTPGDSVPGSGTEPVPAHREPDGEAVEAFEHDAGLPTDPDSEMKAASRLKGAGAPTSMGYLHDLLCPAFDPAVVDATYKSAEVPDLTWWQNKALDAATSAPLDEAAKATQLWQHAVTLKGLDPGLMLDIRRDLHKRFTDANSDMGSMPTPMELSPTRFRRPHLTPGHADYGSGYGGPNTHSVPSGGMSAAQYTDGYIAAGHAAESPSNKNNGVIGYPAETGKPTQVNYQEAQRNIAASAMSAMHDHIAQTFPDVCAMHAPGHGGMPPEGARPVAAAKADKKVKKTKDVTKGAKVAGTDNDELLKAIADLRSSFETQIGQLQSELTASKAQVTELRKSVDELGDLPDPATAAFKGVAQTALNKSAVPGGGPATMAETVERTQLAMMQELERQFRTSPDPAQREAAWNSLTKMRGI